MFNRTCRARQATRSFVVNGVTIDVFDVRPLVPSASEQKCVNGMNSDEPFDPECMYSTQAPLIEPKHCQRTDSGEFGLVAVSCPDFAGVDFRFRVGATSSPFGPYDDDPVGQFWEGQLRHLDDGYVCDDDSKFRVSVPPIFDAVFDDFSSDMGSITQIGPENTQTFITSGAGVRIFYAHQYQIFMNWQNLGFIVRIPKEAVHNLGP